MALVYPCDLEPIAIDELEKALETVRVEAKAFGFPVFMRTDLVSGKHDWKNSCFVIQGRLIAEIVFLGVVEEQ